MQIFNSPFRISSKSSPQDSSGFCRNPHHKIFPDFVEILTTRFFRILSKSSEKALSANHTTSIPPTNTITPPFPLTLFNLYHPASHPIHYYLCCHHNIQA